MWLSSKAAYMTFVAYAKMTFVAYGKVVLLILPYLYSLDGHEFMY